MCLLGCMCCFSYFMYRCVVGWLLVLKVRFGLSFSIMVLGFGVLCYDGMI